jgi:predicted O-linked N-acetylglucosamine transferase (SPINDLY family)
MDLKAIHLEAAAALQAGDLTRAGGLIGQLERARPGHPLVLYLLGVLRVLEGRSAEALPLLEAAHRGNLTNAPVLLHMGNALQQLGRFQEAVAKYDLALALKPDFPDALNNRGNALSALKRFDAALASFDAALAVAPTHADASYNRGNVLLAMERYDDAILSFDRTLVARPNHAEAWSNKGSALIGLGQNAPALACFDRAVALQPGTVNFRMNRAAALYQMDRFEEALAEYDQVRAIAPQFPGLHGRLALTALYACDWGRMQAIGAELPARIKAGEPGLDPWTLINYGAGNELLLHAARNVMRAAVPQLPTPLWKGERYAHQRIRLAYVSADLWDHTVGLQLVELLERHDHSRFEVIAISSGQDDGSNTRARIVAACDQFHDLGRASDREVAEKLRALEVDIAVDLSGHTHGTRIGAFEWRPAPVQAAWLGYPGTTGAREMDFIIGDAIVTPPEHQPYYDETIMPLPGCFFPLDSSRVLGEAPTREEAGLPPDAFVFCCFNRHWKITRDIFESWLRLLQAVPGSLLWLRSYNSATESVLKQQAEDRGLDSSRLVFAGKVPLPTHLARHALADLFLDTLPYGAHATAADALWAGLPVLTRLGETFAGRVGASLVTAVGLPELVAQSAQEYEATALALARDPARLKALRDRLAKNRIAAFDMTAFARRLEAAYDTMLESKR